MMNTGFVLEYSLGHVTHAQNLKHALADDPSVRPLFIDLPYADTPGWQSKLPVVRGNWSLRASLAAYLALRPHVRTLDAVLFHTQVTSLLSAGLMARVPSVVSLDATPAQYDALGAFYGHIPSSNARLEAWKKTLNVRAFGAAKKLVAWSEWAKASLVADYGVDASKVEIIPPGIDVDTWHFPARPAKEVGEAVRFLFVGGDFPRKGGDTLLAALQLLPSHVPVHVDIVTMTDGVGDGVPNVSVHRGIRPNSDALRGLFAAADVFVFPTRGDCLPLAVMEALASGLPVITTAVAALPEAVTDGETGLVVPPNDAAALAAAMETLASDEALRQRMGRAAREKAAGSFSAARNYARLLSVVRSVA